MSQLKTLNPKHKTTWACVNMQDYVGVITRIAITLWVWAKKLQLFVKEEYLRKSVIEEYLMALEEMSWWTLRSTYLVKPSGTWPANPGRTGIIPKDLILFKICFCRAKSESNQDWGRGPPQARMLPILALQKKKEKGRGAELMYTNFIIHWTKNA